MGQTGDFGELLGTDGVWDYLFIIKCYPSKCWRLSRTEPMWNKTLLDNLDHWTSYNTWK